MSSMDQQHEDEVFDSSSHDSGDAAEAPLIQNLSLEEKTKSGGSAAMQSSEILGKNKMIGKTQQFKRHYLKKNSRESLKKKITKLEKRMKEMDEQMDQLKRKIQCCPHCNDNKMAKHDQFAAYMPNYEEQMKKVAGNFSEKLAERSSHGSLEFQNIDFHAPVLFSKEMDERAWVYLGTILIAMGSKCMDFDGTLNVFKILKESVDSLRRQVQKSESNISVDFFISQEEMEAGEGPTQNLYMEEIGFDPFTQKLENGKGLCLEGVRLESVQQFDLIYDSKLTFHLKYEALLGAMEFLKDNSWVTF